MKGLFHTVTPWHSAHAYVSAAVLLQDDLGRISIHFRDDFENVLARGTWGYFSGGVKDSETLTDAAIRELYEETGIHAGADELKPIAKAYCNETPEGAHHYIFLLERCVKSSDICLNEGAGFAFIHKDQIDSFTLQPVVHRVLKYYFKVT